MAEIRKATAGVVNTYFAESSDAVREMATMGIDATLIAMIADRAGMSASASAKPGKRPVQSVPVPAVEPYLATVLDNLQAVAIDRQRARTWR